MVRLFLLLLYKDIIPVIIITEAIQLLKDSCKAVTINEDLCAIEETSRLYKDAAKKLLELPHDDIIEFAQWLESTLQCVIVYAQGKTCQISRDKLWMKFHESRSTTDFRLKWEAFLTTSRLPKDPVFYQHLSLVALKKKMASLTQIPATASSSNVSDLTFEEKNALCYIGGYILRSIKGKIKDLDIGFLIKSSPSEENSMEEWVCAVDRGGLIHITESFCHALYSIEMAIRRELNISRMYDKVKIREAVLDSSDVLFNWCLTSMDIDERESVTILDKVLEKFITIRGFSFAKSILETYKQENKKSTQKAKPLRKKVSD